MDDNVLAARIKSMEDSLRMLKHAEQIRKLALADERWLEVIRADGIQLPLPL